MKEQDPNKSDSFSDKPKKKRKPTKTVDNEIKFHSIPIMPSMPPTPEDNLSDEMKIPQALANILQNTINKYSDVAEKQLKEQREDFDCLQPVISEFLDDFLLIGHTIDGQRVVMRYTATPADLDKLTELCKKVLVRMMIQEQNGN